VVKLLPRKVSSSRGDIAWCGYQFGDEIRNSSAVLDIAVEVETRCPALRPLVPGNGRRAVRVDEDTVAVEQEPVDSDGCGVVPGHEKSGYVKMARG
jgi:translation initiation factor IF-1